MKPQKCKINDPTCVYHACMSEHCQKRHVLDNGVNWGKGKCETNKTTPAGRPEQMEQLRQLMIDIAEWSDATFGEGQRNPAILHHLKKEVQECIDAVEKFQNESSIESPYCESEKRCREAFDEYADCFMLLLDSAYHFGLDARALILFTRDKLEVNKRRKWGKPDCNGVVEHIKE